MKDLRSRAMHGIPGNLRDQFGRLLNITNLPLPPSQNRFTKVWDLGEVRLMGDLRDAQNTGPAA